MFFFGRKKDQISEPDYSLQELEDMVAKISTVVLDEKYGLLNLKMSNNLTRAQRFDRFVRERANIVLHDSDKMAELDQKYSEIR